MAARLGASHTAPLFMPVFFHAYTLHGASRIASTCQSTARDPMSAIEWLERANHYDSQRKIFVDTPETTKYTNTTLALYL